MEPWGEEGRDTLEPRAEEGRDTLEPRGEEGRDTGTPGDGGTGHFVPPGGGRDGTQGHWAGTLTALKLGFLTGDTRGQALSYQHMSLF